MLSDNSKFDKSIKNIFPPSVPSNKCSQLDSKHIEDICLSLKMIQYLNYQLTSFNTNL